MFTLQFVADAKNDALDRDSLPASMRGPLHGVPVSIKECYFVRDCDSTAGKDIPVTVSSLVLYPVANLYVCQASPST